MAAAAREVFDLVIVGAGAAGIGAALQLNKLRRPLSYVVLEARNRVGGRAFTYAGPELSGQPVDLGGAWIHSFQEGRPIVEELRRRRVELSFVEEDGALFDAEVGRVSDEMAERAGQQFERIKKAALRERERREAAGEPDIALFQAMRPEYERECAALSALERRVLNWRIFDYEQYEATNFDQLSLREWDDVPAKMYAHGPDGTLPKGYGAFIASLAEGLPVRLGVRVRAVDYSSREFVTIRTDKGDFCARGGVILTLPLGVLKGSGDGDGDRNGKGAADLVFVPPLPDPKREAIRAVGCAVMNKVAMRFAECFWPADRMVLGVCPRELRPRMGWFLSLKKATGANILVAFIISDAAREIESKLSDAETLALALETLRSGLGRDRVPQPTGFVVTRWGVDEFSRGSYMSMPLGCEWRHVRLLASAVGHGRVRFAGEHTAPSHLLGTIQGAFESGQREARRLVKLLRGGGYGRKRRSRAQTQASK